MVRILVIQGLYMDVVLWGTWKLLVRWMNDTVDGHN